MIQWMWVILYQPWSKPIKINSLQILWVNLLEKLNLFKKCNNSNFFPTKKTQAFMNQVLDLKYQQAAVNMTINPFNSKEIV